MPDPSNASGSPPAQSRVDWTPHLRPLLARLRLPAGRDLEIIEELAQHLDDRYRELRALGVDDADARRIALEELQDAGGLTWTVPGTWERLPDRPMRAGTWAIPAAGTSEPGELAVFYFGPNQGGLEVVPGRGEEARVTSLIARVRRRSPR